MGLYSWFLKARFYVHEVIVTIMMNYIALHVTNYLISNVLTDNKDKTDKIDATASLRSGFLNRSLIFPECITVFLLPLLLRS